MLGAVGPDDKLALGSLGESRLDRSKSDGWHEY